MPFDFSKVDEDALAKAIKLTVRDKGVSLDSCGRTPEGLAKLIIKNHEKAPGGAQKSESNLTKSVHNFRC